MKRLLTFSFIFGFFVFLFLFNSPQNNKSYAGSACTGLGGICTTNAICSAESGRNLGISDCTAGSISICCKFPVVTSTPTPTPRPTCATGTTCVSTNLCSAEGTPAGGIGCNGTSTVCCRFTNPTPANPTPTGGADASGTTTQDCYYAGCSGTGGSYKFACNASYCDTAVGRIYLDPKSFIKSIFSVLLSVIGSIAVILIIISGYKLMVSQGNPEKTQGAKEQLTAAIIGLLFVIFALVILEVIGYTIINLPRFL